MIVISNGFNKFHLAVAASEACRRGILSRFITGAYPTPMVQRLLSSSMITHGAKLGRLLARCEDIPSSLLSVQWLPEVLYQIARKARNRLPLESITAELHTYSFRFYGRQAIQAVELSARDGARIYHYRAGFGHESVKVAKKLGLVTLCDHSIAHPAVLTFLVENQGQMPPPSCRGSLSRVWSDILNDIEQADAILVNSDFVKETFLHQGWDPKRVHVIYWGVDDQFREGIPPRHWPGTQSGPLQLLFAGALEQRKGAVELLTAIKRIDDLPWQLEIIGAVSPDIAHCFRNTLRDPRIRIRGILPRTELATRMAAADIFIFPSLAEGSARVVFEALACGCYVITTPNSGSVIEKGVHGVLIPPGNAEALEDAIRKAITECGKLAKIGQHNAEMVRSRYRQQHYGDALTSLYQKFLVR